MADTPVSARQMICDTLLELAHTDPDIVVLTSDSRGSASLTPFGEAFPKRHIELGIAEQNLVGVAAGLAHSGKKPIATSPACFLTMRAIEQIKVDVAYSRMPVLLYGISGGVSYGALGMTHQSVQDIAVMCAIPGIDVMLAADRFEAADLVRDWVANPRPAYLRVGRNPTPDVFEAGKTGYQRAKATQIHEGNDACILATGEMVYAAKMAAGMLSEQGIQVRVLDIHTLKPVDEEAIRAACDTRFLLTMEEHSLFGGLGSMVARIAGEYKPTRLKVLAVPDEPAVAGTSAEIFAHYGLTAQNAANIVRTALGKK